MRIKFLAVIVSFILASIAVSCLDSDEIVYEASTDASVHAFGLDSVQGKYYPFTIDHRNKLIYNADSMPVGADTIIDHILIDTFYVTGAVTVSNKLFHSTEAEKDTIFTVGTDTLDLSDAATSAGVRFKVYAGDFQTCYEYTLKINIHKQDPDSLEWRNVTDLIGGQFPTASIAGKQKSVLMGDMLLIYIAEEEGVELYSTPTRSHVVWNWQQSTTNLPANTRIASMVKQETGGTETLYVSTEDKEVYSSTDGTSWQREEALSGEIETFIASYREELLGIGKDNRFVKVSFADGTAVIGIASEEEVPESFPREAIYATTFQTASLQTNLMIVGHSDQEKIIPWGYDGREWAEMDPKTSYDTYCLAEKTGYYPTIIYYGGQFYIFGEQLKGLYTSLAGLAWTATSEKFQLPSEINGRGDYSMVIDNENFIWLVIGADKRSPNEVWRGRLNRLGFDRQ